ncbi:MAG TPA: hypothetical protein VE843_15185, partial [Ktedonobacteraceae bacterium]|nr:hypothetical protein [Ktedonobacteraceae bacterium]
ASCLSAAALDARALLARRVDASAVLLLSTLYAGIDGRLRCPGLFPISTRELVEPVKPSQLPLHITYAILAFVQKKGVHSHV